ncbi:exonuclease SbcCD subunit D [Desertibacillus haloalkaliphilus]|uniref:exonuclease SbcCD subunit D n=1 Tax=Desertibacillus haloalkaliphilus TaxID=1328930 RepID=UPI001C27009C|nr:exonuclease SbcCD subunit D [Desertibacillus haloalkaliphilus]MBU8907562.1 exonuclease SbcCD subunit D [Desertibacillus haloalkaliphilus]
MKLFHTADWHLGKLIQGVYMTEDQRYVLTQFIDAIKEEKPDAVIVAGDLYDRAIPPTEAVNLLDELFEEIVTNLNTPVLAIAGNHDGPDRIDFGNSFMKSNGLHLVGQLRTSLPPVKLRDQYGEVHFHLVPYAEPGMVRHVFADDSIRTHDDAMRVITTKITEALDHQARHVFVGHAFVTAKGEQAENTSDSERPLTIGGAEHVPSSYFEAFHYTALGHLHQAHNVSSNQIRYAGSPLKYSVSEENHKKGFYVVELDEFGEVTVEKRLLKPRRDMYTVEAYIDELETHEMNDDYVFVRLLDENPVLYPMEKVRSVYPNAMHVERKIIRQHSEQSNMDVNREQMDELSLFRSFYKEVKGAELTEEKEARFADLLDEVFKKERERL